MRISDWSSDVCSSDLHGGDDRSRRAGRNCRRQLHGDLHSAETRGRLDHWPFDETVAGSNGGNAGGSGSQCGRGLHPTDPDARGRADLGSPGHTGAETVRGGSRSEEHTSELQSLMRISYAVFCLKKKNITNSNKNNTSKNKH